MGNESGTSRAVLGEQRPPGQPTDSNRAARREIKRQQQRQQRERPLARIAKNGFG